MTIQEIEAAILQLPPDQLAELTAWLEGYRAQAWDKQIEEDLGSGRLDALLARVDEEYQAGSCYPCVNSTNHPRKLPGEVS